MSVFLSLFCSALLATVFVFLQVAAAFLVDGSQPLILLGLAPFALAAVPPALLSSCGGDGDSLSRESPTGRHWAESTFSFFASGVVGVPVLLGATSLVTWSAVGTSLGSSAAFAAALGVYACKSSREDEWELR